MKKIFLLMAAVVAFAAVSCENDNLNPNPDKQFVKELTVNIVNEGSKVTVTEDASAIHFDWENGDKIYAYLYEVDANARVDEFTYDAASEKFVAAGAGLEVGKAYYVVSGNISTIFDFNDGSISANFNLNSAHPMDELPMMSDKFVASAEGTIADLHHLASIVEIPVIGTGEIYRPRFSVANSTGDSVCRGLYKATFEGDDVTITRWQNGGDLVFVETIDAYFTQQLDPVTPKFLRYIIIPGNYNNIMIEAATPADYDVFNKCADLGAKVIEPGKVYQMATPVTLTF